jgi:hypothetical protein
MGMFVTLEADPPILHRRQGEGIVDHKALLAALNAIFAAEWTDQQGGVATLDRVLQMDLEPLRKQAGQDFGVEDYLNTLGYYAEDEYRQMVQYDEGARELYEELGVRPADAEAWAQAEQVWRRATAANAAAWQPPGQLITCLRAFLTAMEAHPPVLDASVDDVRFDDRHYYATQFSADLTEILRDAKWAEGHGAARVRLFVA